MNTVARSPLRKVGVHSLEGFHPPSKDELAFAGTGPVPAAPYYQEAYFEAEREAIFRRTWLLIGRVSEVAEAGDFIVRPIETVNASVLIVHGQDGQIRAFLLTRRSAPRVEATSQPALAE